MLRLAVLALFVAGCTIPNRTSAAFLQGKMNMLTRTPEGTYIRILNYCGTERCKEPTISAEWQPNGELLKLEVGYGKE